MNGAAVNCQQEQALLPKHNDSSSLHSPGYILQTNFPSQEKNSQHQYSKAMNYKLLPDNFSVDGSSKHSQLIDSDSSETRHRLSGSGDIWDSRFNNATRAIREPMELPVPQFEIDENSVGVFTYKKEKSSSVENSNDLDLDTRIDLLIKSKALSGMHPIFSDLNESEDSSTDSEDSFSGLSKCNSLKHVKVSRSEKRAIHQETFDDPEKPLSRPPSPFLSRATYLFWFNKAIELKQQAKAQEQALLEEATKKLVQGNLSSGKVSKTDNSKQDSYFLKHLLSEVSKELKESIKQDFIKEIIENTVLSSLEDWWIKERNLEEDNFSKDFSMVNSTNNYNLQSKDSAETETNGPAKFQAEIDMKESPGQRSISPKVLFPPNENKKYESKEKLNNLENTVTSIIEFNKTVVKESDEDVFEEFTTEDGSVLCEENNYLKTKSLDENCTVDGSSFRGSNPLIPEDIAAKIPTNDTYDTSHIMNVHASNEIGTEKSNRNLVQDVTNLLNVPFSTEESNNHQHSSVIESPPIPEKPVVQPLNESVFVEVEQHRSSENSVIATDQALDTLQTFEENRFSSQDLSAKEDQKEKSFLQVLINNKENNDETKQNENQ